MDTGVIISHFWLAAVAPIMRVEASVGGNSSSLATWLSSTVSVGGSRPRCQSPTRTPLYWRGWVLFVCASADSGGRGFEHVQLDDGWFECFAYKHRFSRANCGPVPAMTSRWRLNEWEKPVSSSRKGYINLTPTQSRTSCCSMMRDDLGVDTSGIDARSMWFQANMEDIRDNMQISSNVFRLYVPEARTWTHRHRCSLAHMLDQTRNHRMLRLIYTGLNRM